MPTDFPEPRISVGWQASGDFFVFMCRSLGEEEDFAPRQRSSCPIVLAIGLPAVPPAASGDHPLAGRFANAEVTNCAHTEFDQCPLVVCRIEHYGGIDRNMDSNPWGVDFTAPVAPNDSEETRDDNRRAELVEWQIKEGLPSLHLSL